MDLRIKEIKKIKKYLRKNKITNCLDCGIPLKEFYDDMYECQDWHWKDKQCCYCSGGNEYPDVGFY